MFYKEQRLNTKMYDILTNQQFLYWLKEMGIDYWDASRLLGTTVTRIEKYALGILPISAKHSQDCWLLLERRRKQLTNGSPADTTS